MESYHMNNISIKGIVLGTIAVIVIDFVGAIVSIPLFAENMSREALKAVKTDTNFLLFALVCGTLSTVVGGYIAARLAKGATYLNSGMFGVIGIVIGLLVGGEYPLWFSVLAYIPILPSALLGGYLAGLRQTSYA
jgi:hypothetical protein